MGETFHPDFTASAGACTIVQRIFDVDLPMLREKDLASLESLVELVLQAWMTAQPLLDDMLFNCITQYELWLGPVLRAFLTCVDDEHLLMLLKERIIKFHLPEDPKTFTRAFSYHFKQWMSSHDHINPSTVCFDTPARLLAMSQRFVDFEHISKAFADSNFWSLSLAKTLAHVDTSKTFAIRPQGIAPLDVQVSSQLLLPMDQDLEVYKLARTLPDLLGAGLLSVVFKDILSSRKASLASYQERWGGRDPLQMLFRMSFQPHIASAIQSAVSAIPPSSTKAFSRSPLSPGSSHCSGFLKWSKLSALMCEKPSTASLCDNIDHGKATQLPLKDEHPGECSWCQSAVYCSKECQTMDWHRFHRDECSRLRVTRNICQTRYEVSITHRLRLNFARLLQHFLESSISSLMNEDGRTTGDSVRELNDHARFTLVDLRQFPVTVERFNEGHVPLGISNNGRRVFDDDRSQVMMEDDSDDIKVALSVAQFSRHAIFTIARFRISAEHPDDGAAAMKVVLLNVHARLVETRERGDICIGTVE